MNQAPSVQKATLGGGCFWCLEAVFRRLQGVTHCESGYAGGTVPNPTYEAVCSGRTGHAEVVRIEFDPTQISYAEILGVFFEIHDPTTLNRQGNDVGTQYRSVIYAHDDTQMEQARRCLDDLAARRVYSSPIVTELKPLPPYYKAEDHHQEYFENNPYQGYCAFVVAPKVEKARKVFAHLQKPML